MSASYSSRSRQRQPSPSSLDASSARSRRLDVSSQIGKTQLIPAGASTGIRGRGAGFYCEACDLTFKDNVRLIDHYNSRQHLIAVGESGNVERAGVKEVRARLVGLMEKKRKDEEEKLRLGLGGTRIDLEKRLEDARRRDQEETEQRRQKRRDKRARRRERGA